ncbi:MAG: type II toxin-antitoxin system HipA family toxin, partial [Verrucomicrobiae bacterium]|nr:type II toxin-antitoxin system HipA family toxin [Verrucomicrobiae bacterium]
LNISETDNALSFDLSLEVAPHFRLKPDTAETLLREIRNTVRTWRDHAHHLAIPRHEQEIMAAAFTA